MRPHGTGLSCAGFCGGKVNGGRLRGVQILLQCIQAGIPELPVLPYPIRYLVQFVQPCLAISFATLLADNDQTAFGQYLNMFVDGCAAHVEITGHGVDI